MKFITFRDFKGAVLIDDVVQFLKSELTINFKDLSTGLSNRLKFDDNFETFLSDQITLAAGEEGKLAHRMKATPQEWHVSDAIGGNNIVRGATQWDRTYAYFKNAGSVSSTFRIRFFP